MTYHKKNLLEAFQASAAAEKAKASSGASAPKAGGPFAKPAPEPAVEPGAPTDPRGSGESRAPFEPTAAPASAPRRLGGLQGLWGTDGVQRLIVLQVLITIAAFFLGRASVSSVDAGAGPTGEPRVAGEGDAAPLAGQPAGSGTTGSGTTSSGTTSSAAAEIVSQPGTPAERALLDPRNLYTVKVVEYRTGHDEAIALSTLQYFLDQGLPAVAQVHDGRLFLLLGAAPTQKELSGLLETAKTMRGPPPLDKPAEFHDAFVVGIDRLGIR